LWRQAAHLAPDRCEFRVLGEPFDSLFGLELHGFIAQGDQVLDHTIVEFHGPVEGAEPPGELLHSPGATSSAAFTGVFGRRIEANLEILDLLFLAVEVAARFFEQVFQGLSLLIEIDRSRSRAPQFRFSIREV